MDDKLIQIVGELLGLLDQLVEEKGVPKDKALADKNIVGTSIGSKKLPTKLPPNAKRLLEETFTLFNKMFFDYQKKMAPDTKDKTLVSNVAKTTTPPSLSSKDKEGKEQAGGFWSGIGKLFMGVGTAALAALIGGLMDNGPFKGVAKIFAKVGVGLFAKMSVKLLKYFGIAAKRIPFLGSIVSLGFAWDRYQNNDNIGAIIDVLSAVANLIPPPVGTILSLGLDVLNAFLDYKSGQSEGTPQQAKKMDILKDMTSSIGGWLWDRRTYIPVLSSINRFMLAWTDLKAGKIASGLGHFGKGVLSLFTGVDVDVFSTGLAALLGMVESTKAEPTDVSASSVIPDGMMSAIGSWLWSKRQYIPILSSVNRFMMAWDDIKAGNIMDGLGNIGIGLLSFLTRGDAKMVLEGMGAFMGMIGGTKETVQKPVANSSMLEDMAVWMGKKISELVGWIKDLVWNRLKALTGDLANMVSSTWTGDNVKQMVDVVGNKAKEAAKVTSAYMGDMWNSFSTGSKVLADKSSEMMKQVHKTVASAEAGIKESAKGAIAGAYVRLAEDKQALVSKTPPVTLVMPDRGETTDNLANLYKSSIEQIRLLGLLVGVGNSSLSELRRIAGISGGGGGGIAPPQASNKSPLVQVATNREGFADSPYVIA